MSDDKIGCGDNSCIFAGIRSRKGMGTNGGCRCFEPLVTWSEVEKRWNRVEVNKKVRRDVLRLARTLKENRDENEKLREALANVVRVCRLNCTRESNCKSCAEALAALPKEYEI